jgi:transcription elongation factor SPT6
MRLAQMDQGDCIIRPSSKGPDHLTASWKIHDGVCGHIDIKEDEKINNYTLGKRLYINNEVIFKSFNKKILL